MPNKYLQVRGIATYVHHSGPTTLPGEPPDTSRGQTLVCLHGIGVSGASFEPLFPALEEHHSVIAFDSPGHGRSGELDSLGSVDSMATHAAATIAKLQLDRPILVGEDLGAAVAIELALANPDAWRGLILLTPFRSSPISEATFESTCRTMQGKERRGFPKHLYGSNASPEMMRSGFIEGMKTDPRARFGDMQACRDWTASRLNELQLPVLIITGAEDVSGNLAEADRVAQAIPNAERVSIEKTGHYLCTESPDTMAQAIRRFVGTAIQ